MDNYYFDRLGNSITREQWTRLFMNLEYREVAKTEMGQIFEISTVWLGLNHSWVPDVPPAIFETLLCVGESFIPLETFPIASIIQERYPSEDQAIAGHNRLLHVCYMYIAKLRWHYRSLQEQAQAHELAKTKVAMHGSPS